MAYNFSKLSILVVDDSPDMLDVVANALKYLGVGHVHPCKDADTAFQSFLRNKPDIILTDWEMGSVSGLDLVRRIRRDPGSHNRQVPVVIMTGYTASSRVGEARDWGVTEFLVKPFTASELARRIAYVIDAPRDFVETEQFFGPDRRRRRGVDYQGPERRDGEE